MSSEPFDPSAAPRSVSREAPDAAAFEGRELVAEQVATTVDRVADRTDDVVVRVDAADEAGDARRRFVLRRVGLVDELDDCHRS